MGAPLTQLLDALTDKTSAPASGKTSALVQKAKKSSQDFEAIFLAQFLNSMTENIGQETQDQGFGAGSAETQWRTFMNEQLAGNIVKQGGIGLSDSIMQEVLKAQGA